MDCSFLQGNRTRLSGDDVVSVAAQKLCSYPRERGAETVRDSETGMVAQKVCGNQGNRKAEAISDRKTD